MKLRHWITAIVLLLLVTAAIAGLVWTRPRTQPAEADETGKASSKAFLARSTPTAPRPLVDQRPLQTARRMASLAATPEEQLFAHQAEKVADREVDLAFFDALRATEENPPKLSPEAKEVADRKNKAEVTLKEDQENIVLLTRKLAAAPDSRKDNLQDQIEVAKAQADLDQDEFDDASEDLEQVGGDPQSRIKRLKAQHDASDHSPTAPSAINPYELDYQAHTMLTVFRAWKALREKKTQLEEARQETAAKAERLSQRHDVLAAQVEKEKLNREGAKQQARGFATGGKGASREESKAGAQIALDSLKQYSRDQKNLADLGKRVQDEKELSDVYASWILLTDARRQSALHNLIECVLWILLVLFAVYMVARLIDRLFTSMKAENKRIDTLRAMAKVAAEIVGVMVIAFIVFGMPSQTTEILGLAGAGLTVASKDVIMAFFGWFLLMGRNGIRVGDWVEIEGVGGEVIEIGLLKTVLLETGNWTDAGHPTGRQVSFVNSFAIEGHYFNFSTSGQWMWDELQLTISADQDPYTVIDKLQQLVVNDTEANAAKAEQEWQQTTTRYHVQGFSAEPAISVRPTGSGVEVRVRYITRAYERHETRKRLYEAVVELMHGKREQVKP
jgi:small-conductance mechanosensitive channel